MKSKLSREYDGRSRWLYQVRCIICKKPFWIPHCCLGKTKSCSFKCARQSVRRQVMVTCPMCKKYFEVKQYRYNKSKREKRLLFCGRPCKENAQRIDVGILSPSQYKGGRASYRKRALEKYGAKCMRCGYSNYVEMLDIHHKHGKKDSKIKDLEVLCVWCHVFETRIISKGKIKSSMGS